MVEFVFIDRNNVCAKVLRISSLFVQFLSSYSPIPLPIWCAFSTFFCIHISASFFQSFHLSNWIFPSTMCVKWCCDMCCACEIVAHMFKPILTNIHMGNEQTASSVSLRWYQNEYRMWTLSVVTSQITTNPIVYSTVCSQASIRIVATGMVITYYLSLPKTTWQAEIEESEMLTS